MNRIATALLAMVVSGAAYATDPVPDSGTAGGTNIDGSLNSNVGNQIDDDSYSHYENSSTYSDSSSVVNSGSQTTNNYEGALVTNNTSNVRSQTGPSAGTAVAPSMGTSGYDSCSQAISGGATGPGFGISLGKHVEDDTCEIIKLSKLLSGMGFKDAALALAMQDKRVARAFRVANPNIAAKLDVRADGEDFREEFEAETQRKEAEEQREAEVAERREHAKLQEENYVAVTNILRVPEDSNEIIHVYREGDTLWSIAEYYQHMFNGSVNQFMQHILQANPVVNFGEIPVGTYIKLNV